jgi:hypothetical protein
MAAQTAAQAGQGVLEGEAVVDIEGDGEDEDEAVEEAVEDGDAAVVLEADGEVVVVAVATALPLTDADSLLLPLLVVEVLSDAVSAADCEVDVEGDADSEGDADAEGVADAERVAEAAGAGLGDTDAGSGEASVWVMAGRGMPDVAAAAL